MFSGKRYPLLCLMGALLVFMSFTMQLGLGLFPQINQATEWSLQLPGDLELPDGAEKEGDDQSDSLVTTVYYADFISGLAQLPKQQYPLDTALPEDPLSLPFQPPV
jgi:hypothetical protein